MDAPELKYLAEIERYLDGEMTEEERVHFEQELTVNKQLKVEFEVLQHTIEQIKAGRKNELKHLLQSADADLDSEAKPKIITFWRYAAAAAVLLLIGIGFLWSYLANTNGSEGLLAAYWQKDSGLPVMMDEQANAKFDNAMSAYKNGNYATALSAFEILPQNDTTVYYTALCRYELKQDAFAAVQQIANDSSSIFQSKAKYYLLLLYVKQDKAEQAKALLNELLAVNNHPYRSQISALSRENYFVR